MSSSANVRSLEAIREFKVRMGLFREDVSGAMDATHQELNRVLDWLENDRPRYWRQQVRRYYDRVGEARARLAACRRRTVGDRRPSCIEEEQDLQRAKRQLRCAQEKVEIVRRWSMQFRHELEEYKGGIAPLVRSVTGDIPRSIGLLDRILDALDSYVSVPPGDRSRPTGESTAKESVDEPPQNNESAQQT